MTEQGTLWDEPKPADEPAKTPVSPGSVVYFIQAGADGPIKIGVTGGDVAKRRNSLQVGHPIRLRVLKTIRGDVSTEARFHATFATSRLEGEWFLPSPALLEAIASATAEETQPSPTRHDTPATIRRGRAAEQKLAEGRRLVEMRQRGKTIRELREVSGRDVRWIKALLREAGLSPSDPRGRPRIAEVDRLAARVRRLAKSLPQAEIARRLGLDRQRVHQLLARDNPA